MDIKKIIAKLPVGFAEDTAGMNADQLKAHILDAIGKAKHIKQERKADEKLTGARELMKDLGSAYSEALKTQNAKVDYCLHVLEERGEPIGGLLGELGRERTVEDAKREGGKRSKSRAA